MAYYPAHVMPVPNDLRPQPVDRKAAMATRAELETPAIAADRRHGGAEMPPMYRATPADPDGPIGENVKPAVYGAMKNKS
jgi:hypothetical protein